MQSITISARFISGSIGLSICYLISYYLFWDSQFKLNDFHIDPQNSLFRTVLDNVISRDKATTIAVIVAFISIHLCWAWRFKVGFLFERLLQRNQFFKQAASHYSAVTLPQDQTPRVPVKTLDITKTK